MKNISVIIRRDMRMIRHNSIAIVVLFGVIVLPSFFAWFNVLSSWDPFGNVKNLKVAVANADDGYQSDLFPMKINVGEQVIANLRANSDLDWVFTSEEQAIEGTKAGEYYAALVLPDSFSRDMMTFLSPGAQQAQIEYYSNEKKNALSPKITQEAASDVSTTINSTFTKTLNEVGLALISSVAEYAGSDASRDALQRLDSSVVTAATTLDSTATTLEMFGSLIGSSRSLVSGASSLTDATRDAVRSASGAIGSGAGAAESLKAVLGSATSTISSALKDTSASYKDLIDQVSALDASFVAQSKSATALLKTASTGVDGQIAKYTQLRDDLQAQADATTDPAVQEALELVVTRLDGAIDRQQELKTGLDGAVSQLETTNAGMGTTRDEIVALADEARASLDGARDAYDGTLRPELDRLAGSLDRIDSGFGQIGRDLDSAATTLSGGSDSLLVFLTETEQTTDGIAQDLRELSTLFGELSSALQTAVDSGDLSEVTELIGANPDVLAGELTTPVGLKRIAVYKVDTFGAQMAPFYSVLGLWVGALLLSVLIRTDVAYDALPAGTNLTKYQEYIGRYGIFAILALLQSSLVYLGLMGFVGVQPAHPVLLLLAGWVMSFVFSLITYTLVLSFGEAGKALAVFLLVVQISAGGGAYPLAVLPQWFQNISPWLPVTHATDAVRAAIAGIYQGDYWISLGILALFLVPTLLIGLVLRLPVLKINNDLTRALESTKLM